jgi:hypothetical protein
MIFGAKVGNLGRDLFSDFWLCLQSRFVQAQSSHSNHEAKDIG